MYYGCVNGCVLRRAEGMLVAVRSRRGTRYSRYVWVLRRGEGMLVAVRSRQGTPVLEVLEVLGVLEVLEVLWCWRGRGGAHPGRGPPR